MSFIDFLSQNYVWIIVIIILAIITIIGFIADNKGKTSLKNENNGINNENNNLSYPKQENAINTPIGSQSKNNNESISLESQKPNVKPSFDINNYPNFQNQMLNQNNQLNNQYNQLNNQYNQINNSQINEIKPQTIEPQPNSNYNNNYNNNQVKMNGQYQNSMPVSNANILNNQAYSSTFNNGIYNQNNQSNNQNNSYNQNIQTGNYNNVPQNNVPANNANYSPTNQYNNYSNQYSQNNQYHN